MTLDDWITGVQIAVRETSDVYGMGHTEINQLAKIYERHTVLYGKEEGERYTVSLITQLKKLYEARETDDD